MATRTVTGHGALIERVTGWTGPIEACCTSPRFIAELVLDHPPPVSVVTDTATIERLTTVAYLEWWFEQRRRDGTLEVSLTDSPQFQAVTGPDEVGILVDIDGIRGGIVTDVDGHLGRLVRQHYSAQRDRGTPWSGGSTALDEALGSFERCTGGDGAALGAILADLWSMHLDGTAVDALDVAVLVAAAGDAWAADVGQWSRSVGLGTEADVSRSKRRLDDGGYLAIESERGGIGRPQHRLYLVESALGQTDRSDLAVVANHLLG